MKSNIKEKIAFTKKDAVEYQKLTSAWFDFALKNQGKFNSTHGAIFLWIIQLNYRGGWKRQFTLPTESSMKLLSIKDVETYNTAVADIESWGFINVVSIVENQSSLIEICLT